MKKLKNVLLICGLFSLSACGWLNKEKDEGNFIQSVENVVKEWKLLGSSWESQCAGSEFLGTHSKEIYKFEGDIFTISNEYYFGDDKCAGNPSITQTYNGTFKIGSVNEDVEKARNIDFSYNESFLDPHTADGAQALNNLAFCGIDNWKSGSKIKLTDKRRSLKCPIHKVPQKRFDVIKVEDNKLFFGNSSIFELPKSRPTELDRDLVYTKKD